MARQPPKYLRDETVAPFVILFSIFMTCLVIFGTLLKTGPILFAFHPVFLAIAYLLLMTNSILVIKMRDLQRKLLVWIHLILQCLSLGFAYTGLWAIWANKDRTGKDHLTSWHGSLGLLTIILSTINFVVGNLLYFRKIPLRWIKSVSACHRWLGMSTFLLSFIVIAIGVGDSAWAQKTFLNSTGRNLFIAGLPLLFVAMLFPFLRDFKIQMKSTIEESRKLVKKKVPTRSHRRASVALSAQLGDSDSS